MKFVIELSSKIWISLLFLVFLSDGCPTNWQCRTCVNEANGCIDCFTGQGLSMEMYPSPIYICSDCGDRCANCINGTICTECDQGYGPLGVKNCNECEVKHCLSCPNAIETCTQCIRGYGFYNNNNTCGACSPYCKLYGCDRRLPGNCDKCDPGYGYNGTTYICGACSPHCSAGCYQAGAEKCDQCDPGFGKASNGSCALCSSNCVAGCNKTGAGRCDTCNAGYETASDGSCQLITTTPITTTTRTTTTAAATSTSTTTTTAAAVQSSSENPASGTTGLPNSQTTGQKDTTANPISGVTSISGNPISGEKNFTGATGSTTDSGSGRDRFNSDTAIMATLLSLIIGGIIISVFVIGFWCSRFSAAAAIKTTTLQEPLLQEPVRRTVIAPDNYRWRNFQNLRN